MVVLRAYIDTCIFVSYFDPNDTDEQHEKVINFISEMVKYNGKVKFFTSDFTLTELTKVLILEKNFPPDRVHDYVSRLARTKKIGGLSFDIVNPYGRFSDFFVGIQTELLEHKPGLGDAVHITIMKDNRIYIVITSNKKDFEKVKMITPLYPSELLENVKRREAIKKKLQ